MKFRYTIRTISSPCIFNVHLLMHVYLQVLDDKNVRRRFRASNYQSTTRVKPFICTMPMRLDDGWNQIQFNLSDFTRRAYGTNYIETLRVQVRKERERERESVCLANSTSYEKEVHIQHGQLCSCTLSISITCVQRREDRATLMTQANLLEDH